MAVEIFIAELVSVSENMKNVFQITENPYDSRNKNKFKLRNVHTVRYGIESGPCDFPTI